MVADVTILKSELSSVEAELAGLGDRRKALEQAADDLRSAIAALEALNGGGSTTRRRARKATSKPKPKRPTVTPEDLTGALQELGGEATVEQLVEALSLPDGRSLNGARRVAVEAGTVAYEDRTYRLTEASSD
jgi:hypothetical protein